MPSFGGNEESKHSFTSADSRPTPTARNSTATVFSLAAKINSALQAKKKTQMRKARLSAMHGFDEEDSDFNASDYDESSDDSASD